MEHANDSESDDVTAEAAAPDLKSSADRLISFDEFDEAVKKHPAFKPMTGEGAELWLSAKCSNAFERGEFNPSTCFYLLRPRSQGAGYALSLIRYDMSCTVIRHYAFDITFQGYKCSQFRDELNDKNYFIYFNTIDDLID